MLKAPCVRSSVQAPRAERHTHASGLSARRAAFAASSVRLGSSAVRGPARAAVAAVAAAEAAPQVGSDPSKMSVNQARRISAVFILAIACCRSIT